MTQGSRKKRLRRVVLLCCHFVRNLAYYRESYSEFSVNKKTDFFRTINNNFLDLSVIEWCKLFADPRGKHYWENIIDGTNFKIDMLNYMGETVEQFDSYAQGIRHYRDKFLAHLDDELVMQIPMLERAKLAAEFYHAKAVASVITASDLSGLPHDLGNYYELCIREAKLAISLFKSQHSP